MTDEEMIENLKCVIADISEQCEQLKAKNADLNVKNEVLQRDVENLTRTLEEGGEEYRALQEENAQLRARLEKAVELPFSIGDMAYYCQYINGKGYCLIERKIVGIKQIDNEQKWWDRREKIMVAIVQGETDDGEIGEWWYDIGAFGTEWGIEKSIFEKQLAELKGENNDD